MSGSTLNVLVIDRDASAVAGLQRCLTEAGAAIRLRFFDASAGRRLDEDFDWQPIDVLLLGYELAEDGPDGNWLAELRSRPGLPPTVLLSATADEYVAVRALQLGAEDFLLKQDASAERIVDRLHAAALGRPPHPTAAGFLGKQARRAFEGSVARGLNRFQLLRKIGAGAQSRVYLARRRADREMVAVKLIAVSTLLDDDTLRRYEREGAALERIDSPHVIKLHDHAFSDDSGFLALEHLRGGDLRRHLRSPLQPARALGFISQILSGLATVHGAGVLHRDLKPMNLMLRDARTVVIADFGISRFSDSDAEHTTEAMLLGTPAYMSPEQCMGQKVDERADLYSAGVIFYEMLMGGRPYVGRAMMEILQQHVMAPVPTLPPALSRCQPLLDGLMAKEVGDRLPSAGAALALLQSS